MDEYESGEKEVFLDYRNGGTDAANGSPPKPDSSPPPVSFSAKLPEVAACCSALSFHFALGLVLAYSAVLLPQLEHPDSDLKITTDEASLVASVVALSVPIGSLVTGPIMEALGRLRTVQLAALPYCIGCALIATANGFPMLLAGRFLTGMSAGTFGTNPAIVYTTEVARPELRGSLISIGPFMVSLGTFVTYIVGAYLHWRTLSWLFMGAPLLTLAAMLLWSPESPIWLVGRGRKDQALRSIHILARHDPDKLARAAAELATMVDTNAERVSTQRRGLAGFLATMFLERSGLRPLLVIMMLFALQQFSGIYVTLFFTVKLFKEVGSALDPNTASMIVGAIRVVTSVQATLMMRRFGRRPLLVASATISAACMLLAGYYARRINPPGPTGDSLPGNQTAEEVAEWERWVPVVAILGYVYAGMLGMLTIPWTMTAELFAPRVRSLGQGLSVALANVFMFGAVQSYQGMVDGLGGVGPVLWFYAAVCVLAVVFALLFVPETHRRTLAEIEEYFNTSLVYPLHQRRRARQARHADGVVNRADTEQPPPHRPGLSDVGVCGPAAVSRS